MFTARDAVELVFKVGSKFIIHVFGEVVCKEAVNDAADISRRKTATFELYIVAVNQGRNDVGVGRWAADIIFFQCFDQTGFSEPWRWLCEVLVVANLQQVNFFAFG